MAFQDDLMEYDRARERMVRSQIEARGIHDPQVLAAMRQVPRHLFVPVNVRDSACRDTPLPIGKGQTISQPYIVALMTELLELTDEESVLEIGTGSGYQAAILSLLAREVYTVERLPGLARNAEEVLCQLGYTNVHVRVGDGTLGWPEHAPYDALIVTAAPPQIPSPLLDQLADRGRLVAPIGPRWTQNLVRVRREGEIFHKEYLTAVAFVPLVGEHGWEERESLLGRLMG
jgi:protein-L-isoaspartate(D-aspartate) O-methyltransferase